MKEGESIRTTSWKRRSMTGIIFVMGWMGGVASAEQAGPWAGFAPANENGQIVSLAERYAVTSGEV